MPSPFEGQNLDALLEARAHVEAELAKGRAILADVNSAIAEATKDALDLAMKATGKYSGTINFMSGTLKLKADIKKDVKWDSAALAPIVASMPYEEAEKIFKIEFSVPERAFNALPDGNMKASILAARTVKYSEPKIVKAE